MNIKNHSCWLLTMSLLGLHSPDAHADVRLPAIFGDHMVLQGNAKLPVWGWATPGEKITVTFKNQQQATTANADGIWRLDLSATLPDSTPDTLTVKGNNTLIFKDVLVGDVWVTSGQSNMEYGIQKDSRGKEAIANSNDPQLRLFFVPWATALEPQTDMGPVTPPSPLNGKWLVCTPENMGANWGWHGFSAAGYYFARDIRKSTGHPVGMIASYKGGTPAQSWTSVSGLGKDEVLTHYVSDHQKIVDNLAAAQAAYPAQRADFQARLKAWNDAKAAGQDMTGNPAPREPAGPNGGYGAPGNLFNGMISPLIPFALKGVIWYQGEGNGDNMDLAQEYATLFPRLIKDWREKWGQGDFPFIFVQLPNINAQAKVPMEGRWPWVREAQLKTLSLPNTGMAVAIDVGEANELHPPDKIYVGQRLALAARHVAYGENLVYSGPIYDSMTVEGQTVRLKFNHIGSGLNLGTPPPPASGQVFPTPTELTGFGVAGADGKYVWAKAKIDGDTVVVSSDEVPHPVSVCYDWGQNPFGNLYNKEGLPASPFRTQK